MLVLACSSRAVPSSVRLPAGHSSSAGYGTSRPRANNVLSLQASSAVVLAMGASRTFAGTGAPPDETLAGPPGNGCEPERTRFNDGVIGLRASRRPQLGGVGQVVC